MPRRQQHLAQTLLLERFGHDGTIQRDRIYPVWWLCLIWERADQRKLEAALERAGVEILRLGSGDNFVRGEDFWRAFGGPSGPPAITGPGDLGQSDKGAEP